MRSRIYVGEVSHARHAPVTHAFRYPMWLMALDIDELPEVDRLVRGFGHNRARPVSLHDADYLGERHGSLRDKLQTHLREQGVGETPSRIELLTTPRVLGHAFNPVSFWVCYDDQGLDTAWVAEVNNTFGEGHTYVLPRDRSRRGDRLSADKVFHVSPFFDVSGRYEFTLRPPADALDVGIELYRDQRALTARLRGTARPLSSSALARTLAAYPFNAALTLPRILWQAGKLHFRRRLPVHTKPEPISARTYRSTRPPYLSEFRAPTLLDRWAERRARTEGLDP